MAKLRKHFLYETSHMLKTDWLMSTSSVGHYLDSQYMEQAVSVPLVSITHFLEELR